MKTVAPDPKPNPEFFSAVNLGDKYIALGGGTKILMSTDSVNWSAIRSGPGDSLRSLAWTGAQLVAVGDGGVVLTSTDADSWTVRDPGVVTQLIDVKWTGTKLFVLDNQATQLSSLDGIAWEILGPTETCTILSLTWIGTRAVAPCNEGEILSSVDYKPWTSHTSGLSLPLKTYIRTDSQFVALANANDTLVTSPDGDDWTKRTTGLKGISGLNWNEGHFVVIGAGNRIGISENGIDWSIWNEALTHENLNSVIWTGNEFVAVGGGDIIASKDGADWVKWYSGDSLELASVVWTGSQYIVGGIRRANPYVAYDTAVILTSVDGTTWKKRHPDIGLQFSTGLYRILGMGSGYDGERIFEISWDGLDVSLDGIAWQKSDIDLSLLSYHHAIHLMSGLFRANKIVLLGFSSGSITSAAIVSTDHGKTWEQTHIPASPYTSLAWTGKQYVGVGKTLIASPDGINWSEKPGPIGYLNSIAWSGTELIAAGSGGKIFTSPNADAWTDDRPEASNAESALRTVASSETQYVAVGDNGTILTRSHEPSSAVYAKGPVKANASVSQGPNRLVLSLTEGFQPGDHARLLSLTGKSIGDFRFAEAQNGLYFPTNGIQHGAYLVELFQHGKRLAFPVTVIQ
ncbi:MAG: hypothetical protein ABI036_12900 [Fibrobacteria bacterium]